jgi:hypothetical protein
MSTDDVTTPDPWADLDPRVGKLPIWAQDLIGNLCRRTENAERSAHEARLATSPDTSLVQVTEYGEGIPIGLGQKSITFRSALDARWDEALCVRPLRGGIEVRGVSSDGLRVEPNSFNVIRVWQGERG